ncbi:RNA polymerase II C-terminal domain phosphatase-like 1 [Citrus sinensis]|uniref:RNA polymerase II C-terminal domain phosphatase-like 1 n=1 Tax=Citrus sinensis TaxID=2711 RepID=A0ACB8NFH0_CITSI|nr:RNA polymerase II C-terminal domain phosphatase-like 1 [Citrus sinensis]
MYKTVAYLGKEILGEVEIYPQQQGEGGEGEEKNKKVFDEIRISYFSEASERCPPLAVLHTITASGICFKMESKSSDNIQLHLLHSSCIRENKTAVMPLGLTEELHLVAMYSRNNEKQYPCFWAFSVGSGLYNSCLTMLNLRCLGIVFDLDETLIVANTMRSFEDRIEALLRKISTEVDPQRIAGMQAEVKRYQDDKNILKQYAENDQVNENGKVIKVQSEVVPALSDSHQALVRPLIRLQEKNIILTRINPQIRDTSVLVRLRPAWEDLRSYLTARGRKRFEVYVCTMAERDYALEMWRLLDPESNLINTKELLDRIVCVKSGSRKSLFNVFQDGTCHPKMALVIDDRLKVWDDKDQPRVHVVPAFAPYYAPQAEANNAIPVLCVARNIACNVRGGFFKEFDEGLLQRIPEISYEDDVKDIPSPPDVSNYLVSEDDAATANGIKDPLSFDGMADAEVERRLKEAIAASATISSAVANLDPRLAPFQYTMPSSSSTTTLPTSQAAVMPLANMQFPPATSLVKPLGHVGPPEQSLQSSPAREEGEVPESELDPDTRRRLLILQHGMDTRENAPSEAPFPARTQMQVSVPRVPSRGSWFPVEEEMSPRQLNRAVPKEFPLNSEAMQIEKHRPPHPSFFPKIENPITSDRPHENQRMPKEALRRDDRLRLNHTLSDYQSFSGEEIPLSRSSSSSRDVDFESGRDVSSTETPSGVLQDIAMKCGTKVEFRPALVASTELQFSIEEKKSVKELVEQEGKPNVKLQRDPSSTWLCPFWEALVDNKSLIVLQFKLNVLRLNVFFTQLISTLIVFLNFSYHLILKSPGKLRFLLLVFLFVILTKPETTFADVYMLRVKSDSGSGHGDGSRFSNANENCFMGEINSFGGQPLAKDESLSSEPSKLVDPRLEGSKKLMGSVSALKELCMTEGLGVVFQQQPPSSANSVQKDEVYAQVEIDGQVLGKGIGSTWDEAKMQAAEKALGSLRSMFGQFPQKHQGSPRSLQGMPNKRLKPEFPRVLQRMPPSGRYPKNAPPVP